MFKYKLSLTLFLFRLGLGLGLGLGVHGLYCYIAWFVLLVRRGIFVGTNL